MKNFETSAFTMTVHENGFIEFKIKKNISLTAKDVWESRDLSLEAYPGRKFYVLTEAEGEFHVTSDARQAGASKEYSAHVLAHALFTTNLTLKILSNLFIKVSKPVVPTRFFDDRNKAIEWLTTYMKKNSE